MGMGRKRHRVRGGSKGKKRGGGALSSLRGGFRSVAHGVTGSGKQRPESPGRRIFWNVITAALLVVAAALLLRRFGVLH
jgi:hypothetical protein